MAAAVMRRDAVPSLSIEGRLSQQAVGLDTDALTSEHGVAVLAGNRVADEGDGPMGPTRMVLSKLVPPTFRPSAWPMPNGT